MRGESALRLFATREARLAALDALPRQLWMGALTHSAGEAESRLSVLDALRHSLLAGELPQLADGHWPPAPIALPLDAAMRRLELAGHCRGDEELADTLLLSLLFHLDFIVDHIDRGYSEAQAIELAVEAFAADWQDRRGALDELVEVFGERGDCAKHSRWDMLRGLLRSEGWQQVLRIRRLLEGLPELARLIRGLGRTQVGSEPDPLSRQLEQVVEPADALIPEAESVRVPDMPGETRGVCRSDRVARMLPAEAMLLGHPRLRLVWHARRAERSLLAYEDDDRMREVRLRETRVPRPLPRVRPGPRLEMGPLLLCVDTSSSMQGGAEAVAKAVVLEAVRSAHAQRRACTVFAFGGEGEVAEMALPVDAEGVARLTRFLGQAFRGGTDICGPLSRCLERLSEAQWQLADLLIASDGEFGATPTLAAELRAAKQQLGLRVQGVLIGDRETIGLLEIADAVHWVRDWRRYGGGPADSPVHSKSLTSMYFPGALRSGANLEATVPGERASQAVRRGERGR